MGTDGRITIPNAEGRSDKITTAEAVASRFLDSLCLFRLSPPPQNARSTKQSRRQDGPKTKKILPMLDNSTHSRASSNALTKTEAGGVPGGASAGEVRIVPPRSGSSAPARERGGHKFKLGRTDVVVVLGIILVVVVLALVIPRLVLLLSRHNAGGRGALSARSWSTKETRGDWWRTA